MNIIAQIETVKKIVDEASGASDRWLFIAALAIIIIGGSLVIRWLVKGIETKDIAHAASMEAKEEAHQAEVKETRSLHAAERSEWRGVMEESKKQFLEAIAQQRKDFREELSTERHACATERAADRGARHATANALNGVSSALLLLGQESPEIRSAVDKIIKEAHSASTVSTPLT